MSDKSNPQSHGNQADDRHDSPPHQGENFDVQFLTAKDLIDSSIPDIMDTKNHSSGNGLHNLWYSGEIRPWKDFENEVRHFSDGIIWNENVKPLATAIDNINSIDKEHFLCGAEISVSGRFVQNVLHVVSAVAAELQYECAFGDWTATMDKVKFPSPNERESERGKQYFPDYCLIDRRDDGKQQSLLVGEAKHAWKLALEMIVSNAQRIGADETVLRHVLGQISRDMFLAGRKYGFLTTYKHTIFLRIDESKDGYILNYSNAVLHTDKATRTSVSVRQCMLFLIGQVMGKNDYSIHFDNPKIHELIPTSREELKKKMGVPGSHSNVFPSGRLFALRPRLGGTENQRSRRQSTEESETTKEETIKKRKR